MLELQAKAKEELNKKDLQETKELVEALVAEKSQVRGVAWRARVWPVHASHLCVHSSAK
jgi:hypothetical protein